MRHLKQLIERLTKQVFNETFIEKQSLPKFTGAEPIEQVLTVKLKQLEPQIRLGSMYNDFLREVQLTNPENEQEIQELYRNFLKTFSLDREELQNGKDVNNEAALTVYQYFSGEANKNVYKQ